MTIDDDFVICCVCNKKFKSINNKHLQSHNLTAEQYKSLYPGNKLYCESVARRRSQHISENNRKRAPMSEAGRQRIREANTGRSPSNKGVKLTKEQKEAKQHIYEKREQKKKDTNWQHPRLGLNLSQETKDKISNSLMGHKSNPESIQKGLETKRRKNNGKIPGSMTGKHHSAEAIEKIKNYAKSLRTQRDLALFNKYNDNLKELKIELLELAPISKFKCRVCDSEFFKTRQYCHESKIDKEMCPVCFPKSKFVSRAEIEVQDFLKSLGQDIITNDKKILRGKELDIVIPVRKLAIEYCGLFWHSENGGRKDKDYHVYKLNECIKNDLDLITIFEDEWLLKRSIVESRIKSKLGILSNIIPARKCTIISLDNTTCNEFLNRTHILGKDKSNLKFGLIYEDKLVSAMTFKKGNISRKSQSWEISRYSVDLDTLVLGGAQKLFKHFIKQINPDCVLSYSDLRWGHGDIYAKLGFSKVHNSVPGYWYLEKTDKGYLKRIHRFNLRKNNNDPKELTEWTIRQSQGFDRIWDCGNAKWVWLKP